MKKRLIVIILMLAIAPVITAAGSDGVTGSGQGCGCPFSSSGNDDGSKVSTKDDVDGAAGDGTTENQNQPSSTKSVFEIMPDMDMVVFVNLSDVVNNPIFGPLVVKEFGKSITGPDVSINKGKGSVGKALNFTKELVIPEANYVIFGVKMDWPNKFSGEDGQNGSGPRVKDMLAYMSADGGSTEKLRDKLMDKMNISISENVEEYEGVVMSGMQNNPKFCDEKDDANCKETPMFISEMPDKKGILISSGDSTREFIRNYKLRNSDVAAGKSLKGNSIMSSMILNASNGGAFVAISTPIADMITEELLNGDSGFAKAWNAYWVGANKPQVASASLSIGFASSLALDLKVYFLDSSIPDFTLSMNLREEFIKSINFPAIIEKISESKDDDKNSDLFIEDCNPDPVADCNKLEIQEEECERSYVMLSGNNGVQEPHNCGWGKTPEYPDVDTCYTRGSVGEGGVCNFKVE